MLLTLVIGSIVLGAVGIGLWKMAAYSQTPKRVSIKNLPDMPFEEVSFESDRAKIKGWFIPPETEVKGKKYPLIILVHGWGSSREGVRRFMKPLLEEGFALLVFDVRGHGESDDVKALTVKTFRDDVIAAVQYARSREDVDPHRIGILGHSFGGFGSLLALKDQLDVQVLVTDSTPVRFRTIMEASLKKYRLPYFPFGYIFSSIMFFRAGISRKEIQELNAINVLDQTATPVLMIHSREDDYVPSTELDYILEHVQVDHLYIQSKGHRSSEKDPLYWKTVIPFFNRFLKEKSLPERQYAKHLC